ncbi:hypothetical protein CYY_003784 [Polysphondylium violaceum]|uniref:Uncharacterized protein n=1 Tax=Polysphondylium violaceum TaxID=133409 RepID=A0A8J4PYJ9_9MYCE|nr:hypothetical protein CYY_003784 [Polysphondylium violaceum]
MEKIYSRNLVNKIIDLLFSSEKTIGLSNCNDSSYRIYLSNLEYIVSLSLVCKHWCRDVIPNLNLQIRSCHLRDQHKLYRWLTEGVCSDSTLCAPIKARLIIDNINECNLNLSDNINTLVNLDSVGIKKLSISHQMKSNFEIEELQSLSIFYLYDAQVIPYHTKENLKHLSVSHVFAPYQANCSYLINSIVNSTSLASIKLQICLEESLFDILFTNERMLKQLERVQIGSRTVIQESLCNFIKRSSTLKYLSTAGCISNHNSGLFLDSLLQSTSLESIKIHCGGQDDVEVLFKLIVKSKFRSISGFYSNLSTGPSNEHHINYHLESLCLGNNLNFLTSGIFANVSFPRLKKLVICYPEPGVLEDFWRQAPNIETLICRNTLAERINSLLLSHAGNSLFQLKTLNVEVSDRTGSSILIGLNSNITLTSLSYSCSHPDHFTSQFIQSNHPTIKQLQVNQTVTKSLGPAHIELADLPSNTSLESVYYYRSHDGYLPPGAGSSCPRSPIMSLVQSILEKNKTIRNIYFGNYNVDDDYQCSCHPVDWVSLLKNSPIQCIGGIYSNRFDSILSLAYKSVYNSKDYNIKLWN